MPRLDLLTANDRPGEYPASWYAATAAHAAAVSARCAARREADVCVVGGGYTGLSAALHLAEAGLDVVLARGAAASAGAPRGATAGSSARASGATRTGWSGVRPRAGARALWDMAEEAQGAGPRAGRPPRHRLRPRARRSSTPPMPAGDVGGATTPRPRSSRATTAMPLAEPLDRAGIEARARHARLSRRHARPRRRRICTRSNYALGLARAADGGGGADLRGEPGEAIGAGPRRDRRGARCGRASWCRLQRLSRRARAGGGGAGDADQQLHRRDRAARRGARARR